jgi:predicted amidohydrolase YtcJ
MGSLGAHGRGYAPAAWGKQAAREEALRLGAQTGHWVTWNEDRYGSIEAGKIADMVVIDGDPLTCPQDDLKDLPVDMTIVGGAVAFERTAALPESAAPLE